MVENGLCCSHTHCRYWISSIVGTHPFATGLCAISANAWTGAHPCGKSAGRCPAAILRRRVRMGGNDARGSACLQQSFIRGSRQNSDLREQLRPGGSNRFLRSEIRIDKIDQQSSELLVMGTAAVYR